LIDILKVPVKKFKALSVGKLATEEEITAYLELKNYQSVLLRQKKLLVYVGKHNTSARQSGHKSFNTNQYQLPVDMYLKQCPVGMELDSWISRGLRLQFITEEEVRKSAFARLAPDNDCCMRSKWLDNEQRQQKDDGSGGGGGGGGGGSGQKVTVSYNNNFVFYNETLEMWITNNIYKAMVTYLDSFFTDDYVSTAVC